MTRRRLHDAAPVAAGGVAGEGAVGGGHLAVGEDGACAGQHALIVTEQMV
jgi:hypothetical protein